MAKKIWIYPILFLFCVTFSSVWAKDESRKKTICLNMIVKDEKAVIERSLNSIKHLIDYWVIVDTGSTDGTQEIIKECLLEVPGRLYERPWKNFAHNRNEAMELAMGKCDYLLLIDADEEIVCEKLIDKTTLTKDCYLANVVQEQMVCPRPLLIRSDFNWYWQGILHEKLKPKKDISVEHLVGVRNLANRKDGNRSKDPDKYKKDIATLKQGLVNEPNNPRYLFYLAQGYVNEKDYKKALKIFEKRIAIGGDEYAEVFWATYVKGVLQEYLHYPAAEIEKSFYTACEQFPHRLEPVFRLAKHYYDRGLYILSYCVSRQGLSFSYPSDITFIQDGIYNYGIYQVFGNSAMKLGRYNEAKQAFEKILSAKADQGAQLEALCHLEFIEHEYKKAL